MGGGPTRQTDGLPSLVDSDPHDGVFAFEPLAGTNYDMLNIGVIETPRFSQDQTVAIEPGQVVELAHRYDATSAAMVSFALMDEIVNPDGAFASTLFADENCDGIPEAVLFAPSPVVAGQSLCVLVRTQASGGIGAAEYSYGLIAETNFDDTAISSTARNDDRLDASGESSRLVLQKWVSNLPAQRRSRTSS